MQRPTSVSVIGWFFIIIGGLSLISGLMALFVSITQNIFELSFMLMLSVQFLVASTAVVGGIGFLRGHRVTRYLLEVIAWILLIALIIFYATISPNFMTEPFAIAVLAVNFFIFSVPLGLIIYYIRCAKVAEYLEFNEN